MGLSGKKTNPRLGITNEYKPLLVSGLLLAADLSAIVLSFFISFFIRKWLINLIGGVLSFEQVAPLFLLIIIFILVIFVFAGLYPGHGRTGVVEFREIVYIVSFAHIIVGLIIFILGYGPRLSRLIFLFNWILSLLLITSFRLILHNRGSLRAWWGQPAVVIGGVKDTTAVIRHLQSARRIAYRPVAAIILEKEGVDGPILGVPSFAYSESLLAQMHQMDIRLAIFTSRTTSSRLGFRKYLQNLSLVFPKLIYVLGDSPLNMLSMKTMDLDGHPALHVQYNLLNPVSRVLKRASDLLLSLVSLVITFPLFLFFSLLIWIDSPGPVIYTQQRLGRGGKVFNIYKFRTMVVGAEEELKILLAENENLRAEYETYHKLQNDPRVTRVGRFLRVTSFDEFPQIINVIKGEMSWVGPRAYLPSELGQMGESAGIIHRVSPGLTGWWQVMGRHSLSFKERLQLDEYYISNFSLLMDVFILFKTFFIVVSGRGA
ncbi:MAG: exopolysaccharide biosynthesis polyprenyl glycosylphosphotransferase [Anaerolineaceae bacterium]